MEGHRLGDFHINSENKYNPLARYSLVFNNKKQKMFMIINNVFKLLLEKNLYFVYIF